MNANDVSRRGFLAIFGGALTLGLEVGCSGERARLVKHAEQTGELTPNMYVSVKKDGRVSLFINKAELGQGVTAAYSTLVAEELDVPVEHIDFSFADSFPQYRTSFMMQLTGGSTSTKEGFLPLRRAGASAREMLVSAAALGWSVPASECRTDAGVVLHDGSQRRIGYGDLTLAAAKLPIPGAPALKARSQWKVIGKRGLRVDARDKITGKAQFGIDVVVPNMVRALVISGPVYGAQPRAIRADAARKMPGVVGVFAVPRGVAVVAEKYWQALAAAPHVEADWTAGDVAGLDTEKMRLAAHRFPKRGESARSEGNVDQAMGAASITIEAVYDVPYLAHAPMEPMNCTVAVEGDRAEVWAPCQSPSVMQVYVADALGIDPSDVLVHTTFLGGGFGRRLIADWAEQAAVIAKQVGRPAQLI